MVDTLKELFMQMSKEDRAAMINLAEEILGRRENKCDSVDSFIRKELNED